jgi:hypothetical protein
MTAVHGGVVQVGDSGAIIVVGDCADAGEGSGDVGVDCENPSCAEVCDTDGDGFIGMALGGDDCDDGDPLVFPGAVETCDAIDNNCDGAIDEDGDGDGIGVCEDCSDSDSAVFPGATEVCNDQVDSDCDGNDCLDYLEDFESGLPTGFSVGGATGWNIDTTRFYSGSSCAGSGGIGNNQESWMELALTVGDGAWLSFWVSGSSELNYDHLYFELDGVNQGTWSGSWGWDRVVLNLAAGAHTLKWKYAKDVTVSTGADAGFVDLIEVTYNGNPAIATTP